MKTARELVETSLTNNSDSFNLTEQRSGGDIPEFYLAHVDKYGQIVGDDMSSKLRISVDSASYLRDSNTLSYIPVLEGS